MERGLLASVGEGQGIYLSPDFTLEEMVRSAKADELNLSNQPSPEEIENGRRLAVVLLQPTRERFGPLRVTSGFRCEAFNKEVGGRPYSAHKWNCPLIGPKQRHCRAAADFQPLAATLAEVFDWLRLRSGLPFDQVVLERGRQARHEYDDTIHLAWTSGRPRRQAFVGQTYNRGPYLAVEVKG